MKILLLSAYHADSHAYWASGLEEYLNNHQWTVLTLPARYFSWRIRSNGLTWAFEQQEILNREYDLIVATSMTDLSTLRGLSPSLSQIPTLVYFHENQFAYPKTEQAFKSVEPQILNIYTALAADYVVFNSEFNRSTFIKGMQKLLKKMPDCVPKGLIERVEDRSEVIPVPLKEAAFKKNQSEKKRFNIVWNHRWEYDKNPQLLLDTVERIIETEHDFCFHVVGQQFRSSPQTFEQIRDKLGSKLGNWGYVESKTEYAELLQKSDVVLSTALHDFQGLAVLEGVAAGTVPVVPDRLAYREIFDDAYRYAEGELESHNLANRLIDLMQLKESGTALQPPDISHLSWNSLKDKYESAFLRAVSDYHK